MPTAVLGTGDVPHTCHLFTSLSLQTPSMTITLNDFINTRVRQLISRLARFQTFSTTWFSYLFVFFFFWQVLLIIMNLTDDSSVLDIYV